MQEREESAIECRLTENDSERATSERDNRATNERDNRVTKSETTTSADQENAIQE
jgi:hypothetical protein